VAGVLLGAIQLVLLAVATIRALVMVARVGLRVFVGAAAFGLWLATLPLRMLPRPMPPSPPR
jgi:hypothetical protein